MSAIAFVKTGQRDTLKRVFVALGQAGGLDLIQIDRQRQRHRTVRRHTQEADMACLDYTGDAGRRVRDELPPTAGNVRPVISHQRGPKGQ